MRLAACPIARPLAWRTGDRNPLYRLAISESATRTALQVKRRFSYENQPPREVAWTIYVGIVDDWRGFGQQVNPRLRGGGR